MTFNIGLAGLGLLAIRQIVYAIPGQFEYVWLLLDRRSVVKRVISFSLGCRLIRTLRIATLVIGALMPFVHEGILVA